MWFIMIEMKGLRFFCSIINGQIQKFEKWGISVFKIKAILSTEHNEDNNTNEWISMQFKMKRRHKDIATTSLEADVLCQEFYTQISAENNCYTLISLPPDSDNAASFSKCSANLQAPSEIAQTGSRATYTKPQNMRLQLRLHAYVTPRKNRNGIYNLLNKEQGSY